jgi:hypothetical protein
MQTGVRPDAVRRLHGWNEDRGILFGLRMAGGDIAHHRDDLAKLIFLRQIHPNPIADTVLVRKEPPRHGLVDNRHSRRMSRIAIGEIAAVQQADFHGVEEIRGHRRWPLRGPKCCRSAWFFPW